MQKPADVQEVEAFYNTGWEQFNAQYQNTDAPPCLNRNVMPQREQNNLPPVQRPSDESVLMKYMGDKDATVQNRTASMKNLEVQIG
ncbi:hypothetical protein V6N13_098802 [Hibiscus sabdariffa]